MFWYRWIRKYLPLHQERQKWLQPKRNLDRIQVGDVLILDKNAPRNDWRMGRIVDVFPDKVALVRSVKVKTVTAIIERQVAKLLI